MGKILSLLALFSVVAVGCGDYKKQPVSDIQDLRDHASTDRTKQAPQVVEKPVEKKVPVQVKEQVPVYKYLTVEKLKEIAVVSKDYFQLAPDERSLIFKEGEADTYGITARALIKDVKVDLVFAGPVPEGVTLQKAPTPENPDNFNLSWTPKIGTLGEKPVETFKIKIQMKFTETPDEEARRILEGMIVDESVVLILIKAPQPIRTAPSSTQPVSPAPVPAAPQIDTDKQSPQGGIPVPSRPGDAQ